jgi:putative heme iron utilization protein
MIQLCKLQSSGGRLVDRFDRRRQASTMTAEAEEDPADTVRRRRITRGVSRPTRRIAPVRRRTARLTFGQAVANAEGARAELVRLARLARSQLLAAS